ncbi:MAG TPA: DUF3010 family protein [Clostridiaceae bacterium]
MKTVCGIEISGNAANIVILEGNKRDFSPTKLELKQINLDDDRDQNQIIAFHEAIENFIRQSNVDKLCVRRPSTSGKVIASPTDFKIEAILQLSTIPVQLLHPTRISSTMKKTRIPEEKYEDIHKNLRAAFDVAFCGLDD